MPHWEHFRTVLERRRPEWARHIVEGEECFRVEIPSAHPTIRAPLTIEITDREPGSMIDVFWGRFFTHVVRDRTLAFEVSVAAQFDRALALAEEWTDSDGNGEARVFALTFDLGTGRRTGWGRLPFPLPEAAVARAVERAERIEFWSWRGAHDGEWTPPTTPV